jgi:hypothetical protein
MAAAITDLMRAPEKARKTPSRSADRIATTLVVTGASAGVDPSR